MSENELAPENSSTGLSKQEEEDLTKDDGLGYVTLMHGISKAVTKNSPDGIRGGDYLLNGHKRIPAGNSGPGFRCVVAVAADGQPLARPRAVQFDDDTLEEESWDPKSASWAKIVAAATFNSGSYRKGAKAGLEIMLWLPDHDAVAVIFCANKEKQISAPILLTCARERKMAQVTSTMRGKNDTYVFDVRPLQTQEVVRMPTKERMDRCVRSFLSYKEVKSAPPAPQGRQR